MAVAGAVLTHVFNQLMYTDTTHVCSGSGRVATLCPLLHVSVSGVDDWV